MKRLCWIVVVSLAGCGGDIAISGNLLDPDDAAMVWIDGGSDVISIENGTFRLSYPAGQPVVLNFGDDGTATATMRLTGFSGDGTVGLQDIWFGDGLAFPASLKLRAGEIVLVNGLRMGSGDAAVGDLDVEGSVLAVGSGAHLLIRPSEAGGPDLRVVLADEAAVTRLDGAAPSVSRLAFGDRVRLIGQGENGYLMATALEIQSSQTAIEPARAEQRASQREGSADRRVVERADQPARVTRPSGPPGRARVLGGRSGKGKAKKPK